MPASAPTSRIPSPSPLSSFSMLSTTTLRTSSSTSPLAPSTSTPTSLSSSPPPGTQSPILGPSDAPNGEPANSPDPLNDVDPQILEALKSKDRLYVLKLGEKMESMISEQRPRTELTPATSYQRLLVHRCSAYYKFVPEIDGPKNIVLFLTPDSRVPPRKLSELVPEEPTSQPAFKIMRRTQDRSRSKTHSQAGSVAGDDADLSDADPSETGSLGGRSSATGGSGSKKLMTIEEREAAYNEARSRIFMDFEEKDKEKGKDLSSNSSSLSLVSGSVSTNGGGEGSSAGDLDDGFVSTPATESEWSGPITITKDKKEGRRNGAPNNNMSMGPSSRSLRSTAPPFHANGSSSSRNSRASSPAFRYASLYEPPSSSSTSHEMPQPPVHAPPANYIAPWGYPYPPQVPGPTPYGANYPPYYGPPYPWPHAQQNTNPESTSPGGETYPSSSNPPHAVPYGNPYAWSGAPPLMPPPVQHPQPQSQQPQPSAIPPHSGAQFHPQFMPSYPYPVPGYYAPQPPFQQGQHAPLTSSHASAQPVFTGEAPRPMHANNVNGNRNNHVNGNSPNHSRASSRSSAGAGGGANAGKRGAPPPPARTAWSYGPGISMGGISQSNNAVHIGGDIVGPRLSSSIRRTSGTSSVSSGSPGARAPGDEASSTASSSTNSSSSRRTFTSTTSSHHPLPPRPDWAVGLKPQPTLHSTHNRHHHHDHPLRRPSTGSPSRNGVQSQLPSGLQVNDFPPLTSPSSSQEKRTPVITGAWMNASMRSILTPNQSPNPGNVPVFHQSPGNIHNIRLEEPGYERPPPKGSVELFNPNVTRRPINGGKTGSQDNVETDKLDPGPALASPLAASVSLMSLEGDDGCHDVKAVTGLALST